MAANCVQLVEVQLAPEMGLGEVDCCRKARGKV